MKYSHDLLYLQKLDVRATAFDTHDENQVVNKANEVRSDNKANEGAPFSHSDLLSLVRNVVFCWSGHIVFLSLVIYFA